MSCGTSPEDAEHEDSSHWRGDKAEHRLENIEEVQVFDAVDGNFEYNGDGGTDDGDETPHIVDSAL